MKEALARDARVAAGEDVKVVRSGKADPPPTPPASPPSPPATKEDPKQITDCEVCIQQGFGWSVNKAVCGRNFANKRCPGKEL